MCKVTSITAERTMYMSKGSVVAAEASATRKLGFFEKVRKYRTLIFMCLPTCLFFFFFSYVSLPGIWVAFVKYNYQKGIV